MKQMGLFKRFTDTVTLNRASKRELEGFKSRLKYGDDPLAIWKSSNEHYAQYREEREQVEELLRRILKPKEVDIRNNWSKMEINIWSHHDQCKVSPIEEHIYIHHYGDKNPLKGKPRVCICCGKEI